MMADKFKVGDVVLLRSGGPRMAVVKVDMNGDVHTCWFNPIGQQRDAGIYRSSFPPDALKMEISGDKGSSASA